MDLPMEKALTEKKKMNLFQCLTPLTKAQALIPYEKAESIENSRK